MAESTVVYECETCWARAGSPEEIEHQAVIAHPAVRTIRPLSFPVVEVPSPGLFGADAGGDRASDSCPDQEV